MELERWEESLEKLRTKFDRKKFSILKRLQEIEENKEQKTEDTRVEVDKLKKKFAGIFIKKSIAERNIREKRQVKENSSRSRNNWWLEKQKRNKEEHLLEVNKKLHEDQVRNMAEITSDKTAKIAQLQLKCSYYEECSEEISRQNITLDEKISDLQAIQKKVDKNL